MDMDFGDAQKESIDKGSEATSLKGSENSSRFLQHNCVEAVISHTKPKKDANLNVTAQGIIHIYFVMLSFIFNYFGSFFYIMPQTMFVPLEILQSSIQSCLPPRKPSSWTLEMPCYQTTIWNAL
jgi:hypothetical protein